MFCRKCGRIIADDAAFCSYCGAPVVAEPEVPEVPEVMETPEAAEIAPEFPVEEPVVEAAPEESAPRKPIFEEFHWNVNDYPDYNSVEKTEDIDVD